MPKTMKSVAMFWIEGQHAFKQLPDDPTVLVIGLLMLLRMICTDKIDCT